MQNNAAVNMAMLQARINARASWFFWIAGLSLVNTLSHYMHWKIQFIVGLGVTQVIDGLASSFTNDIGGMATGIAIGLNVLVLGVIAGFGAIARKTEWGFLVGMILYGADGSIFLLAGSSSIISIGFHLFVLWRLFDGLQASQQLRKLKDSKVAAAPAL